jgi:hypothetical protein
MPHAEWRGIDAAALREVRVISATHRASIVLTPQTPSHSSDDASRPRPQARIPILPLMIIRSPVNQPSPNWSLRPVVMRYITVRAPLRSLSAFVTVAAQLF